MATEDNINSEQELIPSAPGKYITKYDALNDRIISQYAYENFNKSAKDWGALEWLGQAFKNTTSIQAMMEGTQRSNTLDMTVGVAEGITETAANLLEMGSEAAAGVELGAVPALPTGEGETTNPFIGLYQNDGVKYLDNMLKSPAMVNKLRRVIPDNSLEVSGVFMKELTKMGAFPVSYGAARALGMTRLLSSVLSFAGGEIPYVSSDEGNLMTLAVDWLDIPEKKAKNLIERGMEWMGSDESDTLLEQYFKNITGNNIVGIGTIGALMSMFKVGKAIVTDKNLRDNMIKLLYGYNQLQDIKEDNKDVSLR